MFFYNGFLLGIGEHKTFRIMKMDKELSAYETPQVEVIEVEVEKGFAATGNGDGTGSGGDYTGGWG